VVISGGNIDHEVLMNILEKVTLNFAWRPMLVFTFKSSAVVKVPFFSFACVSGEKSWPKSPCSIAI